MSDYVSEPLIRLQWSNWTTWLH